MRLSVFGKVRLDQCGFSRPKPLLFLSYLTLEGPQTRQQLANLLWCDGKGKSKLSVVLNQLKKEGAATAIAVQAGHDPLESLLECDAKLFQEHLETNNLVAALELYQGSFLNDLGKEVEDLDVSQALQEWVLEQREKYADLAQQAMIELAEQHFKNDQVDLARSWIERAFQLADVPETEPVRIGHMQRLMVQTNSTLASQLKGSVHRSLSELPETIRLVFLALSLQKSPNLAVVRSALELPLPELAEAQDTLYLDGLIDPEAQVLAPDLAHEWLRTHIKERLSLLMKMARATPGVEATSLYQRIFAETQSFGGLGDAQKAIAAYIIQAQALNQQLQFKQTIDLMEQVRNVEKVMELEADPESIFLHAYALERSERFKDALHIIETLPDQQHNPNGCALKAILLWRSGKPEEAQKLAKHALSSSLDWMWAQATAYAALGYIASSGGDFTEAVSQFKKSAECYQAAGDRQRWVGLLNNQAIELSKIADNAKRTGESPEVLEQLLNKAEATYQQALSGLRTLEQGNKSLEGRILLNLGRINATHQNWEKAQEYYIQAQKAISGLHLKALEARLSLNLGIIHKHLGLPDQAILLLRKAIDLALEAGEPQIQAFALSHLAILNNDIEQIEVSLDLLSKSGGVEFVQAALVIYRDILRNQIEAALTEKDSEQTRRSLECLQQLHLRVGNTELAEQVTRAIDTISGIAPVSVFFDLSDLFQGLDFQAMSTKLCIASSASQKN